MKKKKLLGMIVCIMFLWFIGKPLEAYAGTGVYDGTGKTYVWQDAGEGVGWYITDGTGTVKIDDYPQNLTEQDSIRIYTEPNEECKEFLKNLSGELWEFGITHCDIELEIGNKNTDLKISSFWGDDVVIYADIGSMTFMGENNITIFGDVAVLDLGLGMIDGGPADKGNITINGNVRTVHWDKGSDDTADTDNSFRGNATITGTVEDGQIWEVYYVDTIEQYVYEQSAEIEKCTDGTFKIVEGVLASEVPLIKIEVCFDYYPIYWCYDCSTKNLWKKIWYDEHNLAVPNSEKECTQEDIPDGAEIIIDSTALPVVLDMDVSYLSVYSGDVTVNGNVTDKGLGIYHIYGKCNVTVQGDVEKAIVQNVEAYKSDVFIGGKLNNGTYKIDRYTKGYFECENVQLIQDGVWNENVLIKSGTSDDSISYELIDEETLTNAVGDDTVGQDIVDGYYTIQKKISAILEQTNETTLEEIGQSEAIFLVLEQIQNEATESTDKTMEAKIICGVDINISSYYVEKGSDYVYTLNPEYGTEQITELPEGNSLEFTVKVPKAYYAEDSKYVVVRQHIKEDGSVQMEQLETTQNGDVLTFESDKFSTFVIVEVAEMIKDTVISVTNADGTVVKKGGIDESSGSYILYGLTAGIYTMNVTREDYVPRTYTIEVETDLETVELDVELHKTGDITGDGVINARDKKMLFNHIAGSSKLEGYFLSVGDVTGDGVINARDKKIVFNHIAGTSSLWE